MASKNTCRICGKTLADQDAQFGDDCQKRFNDALQIIDTTPEEVGQLFLTGDATVQRWLTVMTTALIRSIRYSSAAPRCRREAKMFIEAARRAAGTVTETSVAMLAAATSEPEPQEKPEIVIECKQGGRFYRLALPFKHDAFLKEFLVKVGAPYRCWHEFSKSWTLTPPEPAMLGYIADIVRRHFRGYTVRIEHAAKVAA